MGNKKYVSSGICNNCRIKRCINIFKVIMPGLVFTSVYAVLRGVFWGNKDFLPYSIIELLEEICMIVCGIALISFSKDVYQGAFSAGVAVLISYIFSFTLARDNTPILTHQISERIKLLRERNTYTLCRW